MIDQRGEIMKRTPITMQGNNFPEQLHELLEGAKLFDSSCSPEARVWLVDKQDGFFIKSSAAGTLQKEAAMTEFFHRKGLGPEVLMYIQQDQDWLVTRRIPGEDCLSYLENAKSLCDTTAELLRQLHDTDPTGCPINRTENYIATAKENFHLGQYDRSLFPDNWGYASAEETFQVVCDAAPILKQDTLIHGDYCLPNIILKDGSFSGFIDLGSGGLGDRHIDLFWGVWSLGFNLKTNKWKNRFLDAYGRDRIQPELLDAIGAFEVFI